MRKNEYWTLLYTVHKTDKNWTIDLNVRNIIFQEGDIFVNLM